MTVDINNSPLAPAARFACGPGWNKLIEETLKKVYEVDPNLKITYIKEKFGKLSFGVDIAYYDTKLEKVQKLEKVFREAEDQSANICELCGAEGTIDYNKYGFWMKCLCEVCREVENSKIKPTTAPLGPSKKTVKNEKKAAKRPIKKDLGIKNPYRKD